MDYELNRDTGFWRRKAAAAARPPNLPGPGESHWTPDLREPTNMYREQREAMQKVYADRSRRRLGQDQLPSRDILAAEYEIQLRNATAVQNIIDNDNRVIAMLKTLITEALAETAKLARTLERCQINQRLSAKMVLDRHVVMFDDLVSAIRQRHERQKNLKDSLATYEEMPVETFARTNDMGYPLPATPSYCRNGWPHA